MDEAKYEAHLDRFSAGLRSLAAREDAERTIEASPQMKDAMLLLDASARLRELLPDACTPEIRGLLIGVADQFAEYGRSAG